MSTETGLNKQIDAVVVKTFFIKRVNKYSLSFNLEKK